MVDKKVIFLALVLKLFASAQTACTGLLGKYALHKGNLKICRTSETVQATRASIKLARKSTLLGDVSSSLGESSLSQISCLSARAVKNNAASTRVVCGLSSILCACEQRFDLLAICVHPKSTAICVLKDLGSPQEFRKRVRYLVLKSKDGSCIYRQGIEMPTQVSITMKQTAVSSAGLEAFGVEASEAQSTAGASAHEQSQYAKSAVDVTSSEEHRFDLLMIFAHPKSKCVVMDLGSPHEFRQGMRHLILRSKDGACLYRFGTEKPTQVSIRLEQTAVSSDGPEAFDAEASEVQPKAGASDDDRNQYAKSATDEMSSDVEEKADKREDKGTAIHSWFWIGPVIAAAATIIAAFITIFRCSCQRANGSDPVEGPNSSPRPFGPRRSLHWITIMVRAAPSQADAAGAPTERELSVVTIV